MIVRLLALVVPLLSVCSGKLLPPEFAIEIEPICFSRNIEEPLINGQTKPLASTLENFIALVEKFEVANPKYSLQDEIFYFIRNFFYENIVETKGGISKWSPQDFEKSEIDKLWEPDDNKRTHEPDAVHVFSEEERCSLFFMISHSIIEGPEKQQYYRSLSNSSYHNGPLRGMITDENLYPQEIGVVSIRGTDAAVSLSRVLMGLYVGLNGHRQKGIEDFDYIKNNFPKKGTVTFPQDRMVDSLYALTMAEVLMLSEWKWTDRKALTPNGKWVSTTIGREGADISGFCPMIYKVQDGKPAFSYSSVRGAADGLILGLIASPLRDARLSQVLRMYYSQSGIPLKQQIQDSQFPNSVSFCNRRSLIESLEDTISKQMTLYGFLTSQKFNDIDEIQKNAIYHYKSYKQGIFDIADNSLKEYCETPVTPDEPKTLSLETFLDIIMVLDTSNPENFERQQMIAGHFAKMMDLRYDGSHMTILLDQRDSGSTGENIELSPIVEDTNSSSCAACMVGQYMADSESLYGGIKKEEVIIAVNKLLKEKKKTDESLHGTLEKVVVFFNFDAEGPSRNKLQANLDRILTELYTENRDVMFFCVGLNDDVMKKYARGQTSYTLSAGDGKVEDVAYRLYKKVSGAPALLQYSDCKEGRSEGSATYEDFATPNVVQHWHMPPKYFYKSLTAKVFVKSDNGAVKVCHSRSTMFPEYQDQFCKNTTSTNPVEFVFTNPCEGLTKDTCPPFYLSVMGMSSTSTNGITNGNPSTARSTQYCSDGKDRKCKTLDQIKFIISHEGIRCNSCRGLFASAMTIFLSIVSLRFLSKF